MTIRISGAGLALFAALSLGGAGQALAQANVMKECGAEWQAAKDANKVAAGQTWNQFLAECRTRKASAAPAAASAPAAPAPAAAPAVAAPAAAPAANPLKPAAAAAPAKPAAAAAPPSAAVFPKAVDPKFSDLKPHQQRMKTCSQQYQANKATGGNANMKWLEKGGGYWSLCNKALKGEG